MTVGRNAGGHFQKKGNQRKAIMVYLAVALSAAARRLCSIHHGLRRGGRDDDHSAVLFFTMAVAPSVSTSICLGLTVTLAWKLRKSIDLKLTLPPTLLYAAAKRDSHPLHRLDGPARDDHGVRRVPDAARRLSADGKEGGHPCDAGGHRRLRPARGRLRGLFSIGRPSWRSITFPPRTAERAILPTRRPTSP